MDPTGDELEQKVCRRFVRNDQKFETKIFTDFSSEHFIQIYRR